MECYGNAEAIMGMTGDKTLANGPNIGRRICFISLIILSILEGTTFGWADYRDLGLDWPIAVEPAYRIKLGPFYSETGIPPYQLKEKGRLELTAQEGDAVLACFPEKNPKPLFSGKCM